MEVVNRLNNKKDLWRSLVFLLMLVVALGMTYVAYSFGFSRGFNFDDEHNLVGLTEALATEGWSGFVWQGGAGPLGRPIALMSFAMQAYAWPNNPEVFLHFNTCLHLINGCLVTWLALLLTKTSRIRPSIAPYVALMVGTIWCWHPLLASTNLFVVQRMASLSALFVYSGLIVYIKLFDSVSLSRSRWGWIVVSVAMFSVLAALAKETGALLFFFAWILLKTLNNEKPGRVEVPMWAASLMFWLPLLALIVYAVTKDYSAGYAIRDFNMGQRILTEFRVLKDYLMLIVFPVRERLGPYHDDYLPSASLISPPETMWSAIAILLLIVGAVRYRKKSPEICFAVFWFLAAQVLESTIFPLELYFEHRNYVASFGIIYCLVLVTLRKMERYPRLGYTLVMSYAALIYYVLFGTAVVWGNRELSSELWLQSHPKSERAIQEKADYLAKTGDAQEGLVLLKAYKAQRPENIGLILQVSYMDMVLGGSPEEQLNYLVSLPIKQILKTGTPSMMICQVLEKFESEDLRALQTEKNLLKVLDIALALSENAKVKQSSEITFCVHRSIASIYLGQRDLNGVLTNLAVAFKAHPQLGMALQMIAFPAQAGLFDVALANADMVRNYFPKNPVLAKRWEQEINKMIEQVNVNKANSIQ